MMLVMAIIPGLPACPFIVLAVITALIARGLNKSKVPAAKVQTATAKQAEAAQKNQPEKLESLLQVDPFQI
jgi:flagellar biosynthesis component FlhA